MRTVFAGLLVMVLSAVASASLPAPDTRPGPIGWEKAVTPGFDPPIEYVVVFGADWLDPLLKPDELASKWGPKAAPALVKLYRDPAWSAFQERILNILGSFSTPETMDFLLKEYAAAYAINNPTPENKIAVSRFLGLIQRLDPKQAEKLVEEGLKDPANPNFETCVYNLLNRASRPDATDGTARIEQVLKSLPEDSRLRKSITASLEWNKSIQRAKEPMDVILQQEKGGKP